MSARRNTPHGAADEPVPAVDRYEPELTDLLGLPEDADPDTIERTRTALETYLTGAPDDLQTWARRQRAATAAAYARHLLDETPAAKSPAVASTAKTATAKTPAATGPAAKTADPLEADLLSDHFDETDFLDPPTPTAPATPRPRTAGRRRQVVSPAAAAAKKTAQNESRRGGLSNALVPVLALLLVVGVVYGVWASGRPATPAASSTPTSSTTRQPVDEAKVKELTAKVEANPKDVVALRGLTDQYYAAGEFAKAVEWQAKVVQVQPEDISSRLVLAASHANAGDPTKAEQEWRKVIELDPKQTEAYYNLGILYFSANPPDVARAKAEWAKVVELDPNSTLAKNVSNHMNRMGKPSSSPTGASSGTPAPSSAPAPTGAAPSAP